MYIIITDISYVYINRYTYAYTWYFHVHPQTLSKKCLSGKTALQELGVRLRFQLYPEMQCGIRTVVTARGEVGNCWEIQQRSWIFLGKQECSEVAIVFGNSCSFEKYFLLYSALRISVLKKQKAHTFLIIGHLLQCHFLLDSWIRICETSLVVVFNSWLIGVFFAILDILLKDFGSEPLNFHHGGFQHLFRLGWNWTQS